MTLEPLKEFKYSLDLMYDVCQLNRNTVTTMNDLLIILPLSFNLKLITTDNLTILTVSLCICRQQNAALVRTLDQILYTLC